MKIALTFFQRTLYLFDFFFCIVVVDVVAKYTSTLHYVFAMKENMKHTRDYIHKCKWNIIHNPREHESVFAHSKLI